MTYYNSPQRWATRQIERKNREEHQRKNKRKKEYQNKKNISDGDETGSTGVEKQEEIAGSKLR